MNRMAVMTLCWTLALTAGAAPAREPSGTEGAKRLPTKEAGPVEWRGDRIVSRVLPYGDFVSLFVRLPLAHAAATGQGVKVAVLQTAEGEAAASLVRAAAPRAEVSSIAGGPGDAALAALRAKLADPACRVALVADPDRWARRDLLELARELSRRKALMVVPADLSEESAAIETVNALQAEGALTVGKTNRQSLVAPGLEDRETKKAGNARYREIHADLYSAAGMQGSAPAITPAATAAGVAALVLEKWPGLSASEARAKLVQGARAVWQMTAAPDEKSGPLFAVDPVTTRYAPKDESRIFRFRVLDAAGALGVDTEVPWFLNMLDCPKAWEITKGEGVTVLVTDQGFHLKHPALAPRVQATRQFGPRSLDDPHQNFHGTDMSRILLAVAPEARIVPVLCSGESTAAGGDLAANIARSFRAAREVKAGVVTGSWAGWFASDKEVLGAVREAVGSGAVVSWFHYPEDYPGLLRPTFTYAGGWDKRPRLGFSDRFLTDPPGFHPAEIEAGLSGTAPQAAGLAALVRSADPALTPAEVEEILFRTATDIGGGVLIPDAFKAVSAAKERAGKAP